jgi:hypothetical protein
MISTKRFAGRSITRTLTIGLLALTLAAGARIQLGVAEGHAANTIGSATIAEPGAICLVGYPRYVQVYSPTLVAYDRPQYVEWYVELVENGTNKVVVGWTFVQGISVDPNAASIGVTMPGEVILTVPSPNWVHARIGVNWFDPSNHYAFEKQELMDVKYYGQLGAVRDLWDSPRLNTGC